MGKGKKKGGDKKKEEDPKKDDQPSLSSLSLRDDEPSTSRETSAAPEVEEEGGLTGGARRKHPKKKVAAAASATDTTPKEPPVTVVSSVTPSEPVVPKQVPETKDTKAENDDDEGGLGLGGPKKRRPRKKKTEQASQGPPVASADAPPVVTPGAIQQSLRGSGPPDFGQVGPQAAAWPKDSAVADPSVQQTVQTPPGFTTQPGFSASPQTFRPQGDSRSRGGGSGRGQAIEPGPSGQAQIKPQVSSGGEPLQPRDVADPLVQQTVQTPPGFTTQPGFSASPRTFGPQGDSRGRGAGRGRGQPIEPGPSRQAQIKPQVSSGGEPLQPGDAVLCRYKVPAKILGSTVPCRLIRVLTNYLPMTIKPLKISRYDVTITPNRPKKLIPKAFMKAKDKHFPKEFIAFDQMKNCYSLNPLAKVPKNERFATTVEVEDNNRKLVTFEVSFKETGVVDLKTIIDYMDKGGTSLCQPTEAIQCIDVILRQGTLESYVKAGRQFFKRPQYPIDLGDGLEMWTGLFQSAIFTSQAFINIDVAHKGFPKNQPLVDAIKYDFGLDLNTPLEQQRSRKLENFYVFIKGLRVMANIGGDKSASAVKREFICNELKPPPGRVQFTFTDEAGKQQSTSVGEYFTKKGVRLRYPNLNCMWVGPRDKNIIYPMELLEVSYGQAVNKQLNDMQLSKMVREAATPPDDRKAKIEEVISDMKYSQNPYFKKFGLEIKCDFLPVEAKVLAPPKLEIGDGHNVQPRKGQWQAARLLRAEALDAWAFLGLDTDVNASNSQKIIGMMVNLGSQMGMRIASPKHQVYNVRIHDLQREMRRAQDLGVKFMVVVVGSRGRDYYHKVKQLAERDVGLLTQCIKQNTAEKRISDQTIRNILLKVNSKLMGVNQALDRTSIPKCLKDGGVMVVGADVTHPAPDQASVPSIAAVTASIDPKCFIYNIQLSVQTPKKEMIVEFKEMMVEHLKVYKERQKALPNKIFVFRDGVSEGQFAQVMNSELQAVHDAYRILAGPQSKPEVLFLLVQKRHHTRLFVPNSSYNVEPGTVVDQKIVHARELDFYLVSHQAIKGTARPTRYHAVCNDGGIPHDEVEQLTFYLCHLYSRCMRSVSYPTPTYYAHLACLRARSLTYGEKFSNAELEKKPQRLNVMNRILEVSRMFFV